MKLNLSIVPIDFLDSWPFHNMKSIQFNFKSLHGLENCNTGQKLSHFSYQGKLVAIRKKAICLA